MDAVRLESKEIILLGDFNMDLLQPYESWLQTLENYRLYQLISTPTRVTATSKTLIDHIYVSNNEVHCCRNMCSCFWLQWSLPSMSHMVEKEGENPQVWPQDNNVSLFFQIWWLLSSWSVKFHHFGCIQLQWARCHSTAWHEAFVSVYDKHASFKTIRVRHKPKCLTTPVQDAIHYCDHLLKNGQHDEYRKQRNTVTSLLHAWFF